MATPQASRYEAEVIITTPQESELADLETKMPTVTKFKYTIQGEETRIVLRKYDYDLVYTEMLELMVRLHKIGVVVQRYKLIAVLKEAAL